VLTGSDAGRPGDVTRRQRTVFLSSAAAAPPPAAAAAADYRTAQAFI